MIRHTQVDSSRIGRKVSSERKRFVEALKLIESASVPNGVRSLYEQFVK